MRVLFILLAMLFCSPVYGADITVSGTGRNTDEAIQAALRRAVEYAAGVYVHSSTTVVNSRLVEDRIVSASKSLVNSYSVQSQVKDGDLTTVRIVASVDAKSILRIVHPPNTMTFDGAVKDYNVVKNKIEGLHKAAQLLKAITSVPVKDRYIVSVTGYNIEGYNMDGTVKVRFKFNIAPNPYYWETYDEIIRTVAVERDIKHPVDDRELRERTGIFCVGNACVKSVIMHPDLLPLTDSARPYKIVFNNAGRFIDDSDAFLLFDRNLFTSDANMPSGVHRWNNERFELFAISSEPELPIIPRTSWSIHAVNMVHDWGGGAFITRHFFGMSDRGLNWSAVITLANADLIKSLPHITAEVSPIPKSEELDTDWMMQPEHFGRKRPQRLRNREAFARQAELSDLLLDATLDPKGIAGKYKITVNGKQTMNGVKPLIWGVVSDTWLFNTKVTVSHEADSGTSFRLPAAFRSSGYSLERVCRSKKSRAGVEAYRFKKSGRYLYLVHSFKSPSPGAVRNRVELWFEPDAYALNKMGCR